MVFKRWSWLISESLPLSSKVKPVGKGCIPWLCEGQQLLLEGRLGSSRSLCCVKIILPGGVCTFFPCTQCNTSLASQCILRVILILLSSEPKGEVVSTAQEMHTGREIVSAGIQELPTSALTSCLMSAEFLQASRFSAVNMNSWETQGWRRITGGQKHNAWSSDTAAPHSVLNEMSSSSPSPQGLGDMDEAHSF